MADKKSKHIDRIESELRKTFGPGYVFRRYDQETGKLVFWDICDGFLIRPDMLPADLKQCKALIHVIRSTYDTGCRSRSPVPSVPVGPKQIVDNLAAYCRRARGRPGRQDGDPEVRDDLIDLNAIRLKLEEIEAKVSFALRGSDA